METTFVNKVAESGIITINLENYLPKALEIFDLKDYLFMGLILKEKDFREALKQADWAKYENKEVGITCSADAIIPMWAYMLVASYLQPVAKSIFYGGAEETRNQIILNNIDKIDSQDFLDKRIVIKGCGEEPVGEAAYLAITVKLRPVAKSIMYGEPCSTVPVYKQPLRRN